MSFFAAGKDFTGASVVSEPIYFTYLIASHILIFSSGSSHSLLFLERHAHTYNAVRVVDDPADLIRALQLPNVRGVISNNPLKLLQEYENICGKPYNVPSKLI